MGTEISLFSQKSFIAASKNFVCVRLGTYESKEHQDMVRELLRGTFQNTAFMIYAPDGKTKLTRSGRGPHHAFGNDSVGGMNTIAAKYKTKADTKDAILQDFHSFKQSLNVASADQRLLLFSIPTKSTANKESASLRKVFNDKDISGRFHFDTAAKTDAEWSKAIEGDKQKSGHFIIRPGKFGMTGTVMAELPLKSSPELIKTTLLKCNATYAKTEKRKTYSSHVSEGKRKGIEFENTMPHGEDRDGDGKIDPKRERPGGRRP